MKNLRRSSDKSHPLEDSSAIGLEGIKKMLHFSLCHCRSTCCLELQQELGLDPSTPVLQTVSCKVFLIYRLEQQLIFNQKTSLKFKRNAVVACLSWSFHPVQGS